MKRFPEIIGLAFLAFIVLVLCQGCKAKGDAGAGAGRNIGDIGKATARIDVHADVIGDEAKKLPNSEQKATIIDHAGDIKVDSAEAAAEADKALANMSLMAGEINNLKTDKAVLESEVARLNQRWLGPRLTKVIGWCVAGIFAFGFLSTALGILSPGGWGLILSRAINANIMLPFVWLRDFILRIRGMKVTAVPTPLAKGK